MPVFKLVGGETDASLAAYEGDVDAAEWRAEAEMHAGTGQLRPATPHDIVKRLRGSAYPLTAIDALGWGLGDAQLGISDAVAEAERLGLVVTSVSRGKRMVALAGGRL
jgi:hypothetical protein